MKKFYMVLAEFYDNGMVKAAIVREKTSAGCPLSTSRELPGMTVCQYWFDDKAVADAMVAKARGWRQGRVA
ncbi:hypothetical protein AGMMS49944_16270 [Spirochaetia bacterium]|nr:hypothetical protein AGMMS49944_16270 [Spirochaetia bacterium]